MLCAGYNSTLYSSPDGIHFKSAGAFHTTPTVMDVVAMAYSSKSNTFMAVAQYETELGVGNYVYVGGAADQINEKIVVV